MLKLAPELTKRQQFELETFERWKEYEPNYPTNIPVPEGEKYVDIGAGSNLWDQIDKEFWVLDCVPKNVGTKFVQEFFPYTTLPDSYFDVAFCIDLIAELPESLYRLALSELSRILKPDGVLVISTELDTKTRGASGYFCALVETEFKIQEEHPKYRNFLKKLLFRDSCQHLTLVAEKKRVSI